MKEKKIENVSYTTVYVATDGTEFNTKEDCAKYERTYEIGNILSEWYPETGEDFPDICKQCKWDDCDGEITVKVIWE